MIVAVLLLIVVGGIVAFGWHRASVLPLTEVRVTGATHADEAEVLRLAALPDSARLFAIEPLEVAERVEAEPWVARASVTRWMNGVLEIRLRERAPVMLVVGADGRPAALLDAEGHSLPPRASALHAGMDLPLLTGVLPDLRFGEPVSDGPLRRFLAALPEIGPVSDALLSSIERRRDGQLVALTSPSPGGDAIPVWLGRDGFHGKLRNLEAFWEQAVLTRPEHPIRRIDLRFDGQIVTDEG